jgi:CheY-like chemotaxis protein/predicted regulator of Ras-like GTPase activity (Roadblock/LC7/MglB family)
MRNRGKELTVKNILLVDDEKPFLLSLVDAFKKHSGELHLLTAFNGDDAIKALESTSIDLVVTDLKMPMMDGFELLAAMSIEYPDIPVIVMTAFGTPEIEERIRNSGAVQYIEKPLDFRELSEKISSSLAASAKGFVRGISLPDFLQIIEYGKKNCTLKVRSGKDNAILYFNNGEFIDATTEKLTGIEAAYHVVCWEDVDIEIQNGCSEKNNRINMSINGVLMEGFRLKDESKRMEDQSEISDLEITDLFEEGANENKVANNHKEERSEKEKMFENENNKKSAIPLRGTEDILGDLQNIASVENVIVIGRDGFVIESSNVSSSGVSPDSVGASLSHAINAIEEMGGELNVDLFQDMFIEYGRAVIVCRPVGDVIVAMVLADSSKLGIVRHKTKDLFKELGYHF